ncbi:MAG: carbonic anhydrase [Anaerolineae bacterium]|nr:carbonic anhydrase [Anaerolineae bacterium]
MAVFDELMQANARYAEGFDQGHLASPPKRRVAVLTCMDARLHPESFLGLAVGDAHMIRNAGGRASDDAIRSLVISQRLLGTNEIVVIHHTDCGMAHFTNEQLAAKIKAELGVDVGDRDFLPFTDLEQSVRDDLNILRSSPLIPADVTIVGAIYDVRSGRLTEVARV